MKHLKMRLFILLTLGTIPLLTKPSLATGSSPCPPTIKGEICVSSQKVMRDERFSIRLKGFEPRQTVCVKAQETDDIGVVWESQANYVVGDNGVVNLDQQAPSSGSFDEADSMALIMSMEAKNPKHEPEFCKENFDPIITHLSVSVGNQLVDEVKVSRMIITDNIAMERLQTNGLVGLMFHPNYHASASSDAQTGDENNASRSYFHPKNAYRKPGPAIIVLGGWDGGYEAHRAAVLAAHGYTTLALAYQKMEGLPDEIYNIPLEYFEKALQWLKRQPGVDPQRIGVTGVSMGAHLSLLLASRYPDLKAVVAINPSGLVWQSTKMEGSTFASGSCWSYQGKPLPYVPFDAPESFMSSWAWHMKEGKPFAPISMFTNALLKETPETIRKATIPVENINGPVLITSAEISSIWPERTFCNMIEQRMKDKAFKHPFQHLLIQDVGHLVADPFTPANYIAGNWELLETAGTPKSNRLGSVKRWLALVDFFETHLKPKAPGPVAPPAK